MEFLFITSECLKLRSMARLIRLLRFDSSSGVSLHPSGHGCKKLACMHGENMASTHLESAVWTSGCHSLRMSSYCKPGSQNVSEMNLLSTVQKKSSSLATWKARKQDGAHSLEVQLQSFEEITIFLELLANGVLVPLGQRTEDR